MKKLAIIDGKSVFYRGYYAMPGLSLKDGTPTGGVYGFASLALEVIRKLEPDYVVVAWDKSKTNIRRRVEMYPAYKANRKPAPEDFYVQIPILHNLLKAFGWPLYECDDYEADDIMGTLAHQAEELGLETYLVSSDLDMLQIIDKHTEMYALKKGVSKIEEFDLNCFEDKYGITKDQFLDLKSLKGDSSDNIPGVPGVGEKTALELLHQFGSMNNIFAHLDEVKPTLAAKLKSGKELAYTSHELAKIWFDAPVKLDLQAADIYNLNSQALLAELKKLEFNSLIRRLPKFVDRTSDQIDLFNLPLAPRLKPLVMANILPDSKAPSWFVRFDQTDQQLWCSADGKKASRITADKLAKYTGEVIAYDIKALLYSLSSLGVTMTLSKIYDVSQAAFLLNPLGRDFSLSTLIQEDIDESDPLLALAALWQVYHTQTVEFKDLPRLKTIAEQFDFPLIPVLYKMEKMGIKIDVPFFSNMSRSLGQELTVIEQKIYKTVGHEFNINSPSQLANELYDTLKLPTTGIKKTQRGYGTGQKELDKLKGQHPIIELIEQARELAKLKNTYVDALPKLVDKNSRVHTTFTQNVTSTGRLSSINPNLQNIPIRSELGKKIRHGFVADKGKVFVSADFSQFELRLAAVLADDKDLKADFSSGVDIHTKTASDVFGIEPQDVTKNQRRTAKVINFGVLYGMSARSLSQATDMDYKQAKDFIDRYFELRAPVRKFIDKVLAGAKANGYVETFFGRRRPTPDINSANFVVREAAKRAAANMPIQGTEADLMKRAMIQLDKQLEGVGDQLLQIHDSILVQCDKKVANDVGAILKDVMENIAPELKVCLLVDVSIATNWGDL
ncbi:DNA polymerase I [Candidatus Saccharibacteria bacterium]|nr:DNA polymerase I [Candidatus Saccharibacteria bacterium]